MEEKINNCIRGVLGEKKWLESSTEGLPLVTNSGGWLGSEGSGSKPGTVIHGLMEGPN